MSYHVLARKWRPKSFAEMVGQEHVLKALINALDHDRLHHAYLFSGTRGVGKTTVARILAKCLNCETGVSSEPCGKCSACLEIAEGRFVDLIEVDAASRTKVEDTRELLDNVQYSPTRGRFKIYLIDEVHMLSNHSFNALLKTLEEPPPHVKFLLATTDPQKLPVTILSRCLQFNLKNMSPERIVGHLSNVLERELVPAEESALWLLARAADGSMRDALSLTDQAISFGGGKVADQDVAAMLGSIEHRQIAGIVKALIAEDAQALMAQVAQLAEHAPDFAAALSELQSMLHRIAVAQAVPDAVDNSYGDRAQVLEFAAAMRSEDVQLYYQTALLGRRDLSLASDFRSGFEMTLLRMLAFKPQGLADVPTRSLDAKPDSDAPSAPEEVSDAVKKPQAEEPRIDVEPAAIEPADETFAAKPDVQQPPNLVESEPQTTREPQPQLDNVGQAQREQQVPPVIQPSRGHDSSPKQETLTTEELKPALEPVRPSGEVAPKHETMGVPDKQQAPVAPVNLNREAAKKSAPQSLEQLNAGSWIALYRALDFRGVIQSTASNLTVKQADQQRIDFILDEASAGLYQPEHLKRIEAILNEHFNAPLSIEIHQGVIPEGWETPAKFNERKRIERKQAALEAFRSDPVVQNLQQHMNARLDEASLQFEDQKRG
jgi:DNA polymerase-3 subunit gamma/tau